MSTNYPPGYYSNYTESKDWFGVGFKPTKFLQAAELNDLQRIIFDQIEKNASKIFKDGQFNSGGHISTAFAEDAIQVTISSGTVYALGRWHDMPTTTVEITGVGREVISLKLQLTTITADDDADLLDPASGSEGYGLAAADRFKYSKSYVVNDPKAIPIATFQDGQLIIPPSTDNGLFDQILALMEQRTDETSGSYLAKRPQLSLSDPTDPASQSIVLQIDHGIGYVRGRRLENDKARLSIRRPFEGKTRPAEPELYITGTKVYDADISPILSMDQVLATLQSPSFALTRGATVNGADPIPSQYQPTDSIVSVSDVGHGTYTYLTDYTLGSGTIQWLPGGVAPAAGASYNVVVKYSKYLTKGVRTQTAISAEAKTAGLVLGTGTVTVGGTFGSGHTISFVTNNSLLGGGTHTTTYTTVGGDTTATILAGHLVSAINGDTTLSSLGVSASSVGAVITLVSTSAQPTTYTGSSTGSETLTPNTPTSVYGFTLAHSDLNVITKLEKSDHSHTYVEGTDFTVNTATGQILGIGTNLPNTTACLVSYLYWAHTTEGDFVSRDSFVSSDGNTLRDSTPTKTPSGVTIDFKKQVSFDTSSSFHPVNSTNFYMTYEYSLPRRDILVWQKDGLFKIVDGKPSTSPDLPALSDDQMGICKFNLPAEAKAADVVLEYYDNVTVFVTEIRDALRNLRDMAFNQAQFQLEQNLQNVPTPTDKIGIFADSLETPDLADRSNVDFSGSFDALGKSFKLPRTLYQKTPTFSSSDATLKNGTWVPTYTEEQVLTQPFASSARVINKYDQINTRAKVVISDPFNAKVLPEALTLTTQYTGDSWFIQDMENCVLLANVAPKTQLGLQLGLDTISTDTPWYESKVKTPTGWTDAIKDAAGANPLSQSVVTAQSQTVQSNQWATIVRDTKVVIAGNTPAGGTLAVTGSIFGPGEKFITCTFNGKKAALTATGATVQETDPNYPGTVRADSAGNFTATLAIPSTVTNGLNKLEFSGRDPSDSTRMQSHTTASYTATPNMEYVNLTVKVAPNFNGYSWGWNAPHMAFTTTLGLPDTINGGYATWWIVGLWSWTSIAHVIAAGIAACVQNGISLTQQTLEDAIAVYAAYTSLNTVISGDVIHSISLAANRSSTDIEANAKAMIAESPFIGLTTWTYQPQYVVDPLAQTFSLFADKQLNAVNLYFNVAPATDPVGVAIAEVINGVPSNQYITTCWKQANTITGSGNASVATKFVFDSPVYLTAGKDYAFVVLTEDNAASLWTAVLGQYDLSNTLITKNPSAGVCLESADAKSWQPLSGTDIKFDLLTCKFTNSVSYINTGVQVFDDACGQISFWTPFKEFGEGTKVTHQYSTDNTNWFDIYPMLDTALGGEFDTVYCRIKMENTSSLCPLVVNSPQLYGFIYLGAGAYVHRQVVLPSANARYFDCYIDTEIPGSTAITVAIKLDEDAYVSMTEVTADRIQISDTKIQRHYTYDAGVGNFKQKWRTRISLTSSALHLSPVLSKIRVLAR